MMELEKWADAEEEAGHRVERKRLSENHYNRAQSLAAWLLATLVAVNASAAVATLSRTEPVLAGGRLPAFPFAAGVILAILSGFCSWREAQDKSGLYYLESLREDQRRPEATRRMGVYKRRSGWLGLAARYMNYASLAALLAGCVWTALVTPQ